MNVTRHVEQLAFRKSMKKWAQAGFSDTISDIAKPVLFGLGGYGAARALGGEKATGVPDWLLGPAAGVGLAMPIAGAIGHGISNWRSRRQMSQLDAEQRARLEEALAQEQELQQQMQGQSQDMLSQLAAYQMGVPPQAMGIGPKQGQLRVPAERAEEVAQNAQQAYQKGQMEQAQQQIQQAALAQQIRAQFRGLQQAQTQKAKQVASGQGK